MERTVKKTLVAVVTLVLALSTAQAQKLTGAGATFPYPIYSKWFSEYSAAHPGVEINYQSIGSGGGIRQVSSGLVDFGASDMPMTDEALSSSKIKLIHIPTVLGAVVPVFNVPGVSDLRFSGSTLADIYSARSPTGTTQVSPRTIQAQNCPTRRSVLFIAQTVAAPASSSPTT